MSPASPYFTCGSSSCLATVYSTSTTDNKIIHQIAIPETDASGRSKRHVCASYFLVSQALAKYLNIELADKVLILGDSDGNIFVCDTNKEYLNRKVKFSSNSKVSIL